MAVMAPPPIVFQSTLPARGATVTSRGKSRGGTNFNPRSPRGERLQAGRISAGPAKISIHAPREGSDLHVRDQFGADPAFQSTLPARGATRTQHLLFLFGLVFQSTLPARGATDAAFTFPFRFSISIHAPREGSDCRPKNIQPCRQEFQSTLPARGATRTFCKSRAYSIYFNPRSPRGERLNAYINQAIQEHFNPRSPRGERQSKAPFMPFPSPNFNPRSPRGERR